MKKAIKISLLILTTVSIILLFIYAFVLQDILHDNIMQYTYDHINEIFFDGEGTVDTHVPAINYDYFKDIGITSPPEQFFDLNTKQKIEQEKYWHAYLNENKTTLAYMQQYNVPGYFVKPGYMRLRQSYKIDVNNYIDISIGCDIYQNSFIRSDYRDVPEFSFSVYFNEDFDYSKYAQEELNSFYNNCFDLFKTNILDKIYNSTDQFSQKYWGYVFTSTYYTNDFFANKEINKNNYFTNQNKVYTKMMSMIVKV